MKNLPGVDMRVRFGRETSASLNRIELMSAVLYPALSRTAFTISVTEVFPFVPVTATTRSEREGYP